MDEPGAGPVAGVFTCTDHFIICPTISARADSPEPVVVHTLIGIVGQRRGSDGVLGPELFASRAVERVRIHPDPPVARDGAVAIGDVAGGAVEDGGALLRQVAAAEEQAQSVGTSRVLETSGIAAVVVGLEVEEERDAVAGMKAVGVLLLHPAVAIVGGAPGGVVARHPRAVERGEPAPVVGGVHHHGEADLAEVATALSSAGLFAGTAQRGQQEPHEEGDDDHDDEQLDQCECVGLHARRL